MNMGIILVTGLIVVAIILSIAAVRGWLDGKTLGLLATIIGIVASIATIAVFVVPTAAPSESSQPPLVPGPPINQAPISNPLSIKEPRVLLPVCNCEETVSSNEPIIIRLRWGAKTPELAEQGADFTIYTATVNKAPLQKINEYRKPAVFVPGSDGNEDMWWVFWDYPLGMLSVGEHTIEANVTNTATISDGWYTIEKGSSETFRVKLNVVPP